MKIPPDQLTVEELGALLGIQPGSVHKALQQQRLDIRSSRPGKRRLFNLSDAWWSVQGQLTEGLFPAAVRLVARPYQSQDSCWFQDWVSKNLPLTYKRGRPSYLRILVPFGSMGLPHRVSFDFRRPRSRLTPELKSLYESSDGLFSRVFDGLIGLVQLRLLWSVRAWPVADGDAERTDQLTLARLCFHEYWAGVGPAIDESEAAEFDHLIEAGEYDRAVGKLWVRGVLAESQDVYLESIARALRD